MNNKCIYENILTLTKSLSMLYMNGTVESSTKDVRDFMEKGLKDVLKMQDDLYQTMSDDGYYSVSNVTESNITKLLNKINEDEN